MDFAELVKRRQSDRKYSPVAVEKEKLVQCLEAARLAPSANNSQPWKFIVVDDPGLKDKIADCSASMGMNKFTSRAPVIIAVVLEKQNILSSLGSFIRRKEYRLMDIGIAVSHFCLQATDLGIGTCIIGWFDEKRVKKLLDVDRTKRLPLLISVGYSGSPLRKKTRKSFEEISSWNSYHTRASADSPARNE
ncbi:MAG: nitroreductase family protein [Prolixibacteraceae bacterium]|nr:nitroreductase family protein [Prolixibacteraceae bacterium]